MATTKHLKAILYALSSVILVMTFAAGCSFTPSSTTGPIVTTIDTTPDANTHTTAETTPTTFPADEIQATLLFINGLSYVQTETTSNMTLPAGFHVCGVTEGNDNTAIPVQELHTTHLAIGSYVYSTKEDDSLLYVREPYADIFRLFTRSDLVENWWGEIPPTDNDRVSGTLVDGDTAAEIQALFDDFRGYYAMATTSTYADAKDVNLNMLFYNGFPEEKDDLTEAEREFLSNTYLVSYLDFFDFSRLPAAKMDAVLQTYFGLSLDDTTKWGASYLVYWDTTDAYYHAHTDSLDAFMDIYCICAQDDGTVNVYYYSDILYNDDEDSLLVMKLRQAEDGRYLILSNDYAGFYAN